MQIITLGMHRSGTSLVSSIVSRLGVNVGDKLLGAHPSQRHGHWEDVDFYELNMDILKSAGGNWSSPPPERRILEQGPKFNARIKNLVSQKSKRKKFSWKDPRTCLTIPLYLPHLTAPRFILVYRDTRGIVSSLLKRSGGTSEKWESVTRTYIESMEKYTEGYYVLRVQFERLVNRYLAEEEIAFIDGFVEGNGEIRKCLNLIDFRI